MDERKVAYFVFNFMDTCAVVSYRIMNKEFKLQYMAAEDGIYTHSQKSKLGRFILQTSISIGGMVRVTSCSAMLCSV